MSTWVGFAIGVVVGANAGIITLGLMTSAKNADRHIENCEGCYFLNKEKEVI